MLLGGIEYECVVGGNLTGWSRPHTFRVPVLGGTEVKVIAYGGMGTHGRPQHGNHSMEVIKAVRNELASYKIDAVFLLGKFSITLSVFGMPALSHFGS